MEGQKARAAFEQARKAVDVELSTKETKATASKKEKGILDINLKIAEERQK